MNSLFEGQSNRMWLLVFLLIALGASYLLIKPYLQPIVLAILIGIMAAPVNERIVELLKGRRNIGALLGCLLLSLVIVIPALILMVAILKQGISYSVVVRDWATPENVQQLLANPRIVSIRERLTEVLPDGALDPENIRAQALAVAGQMGKQFAGVSTSIMGSVTAFFVNFMLLLFVLFFVLRDHDRMIAFMRDALPLSRSQEDVLFREVREVSKSALLGSLLTALTQGIVGGFGLWLAGFPGLFWGAVMAFTSLVPLVGTALVWVPAAAYLVLTGEYGWALFLVTWGVVVVGSIDNFLRPMFMQGASMNTVVVFFAIIGGLQVFGLMGLIYGPLIFSITLVLFRLYEREFSNFLDSQNSS
ncbi:MAG: AI-2E family transporter [Halioglobus sp.]|nr:AI-2E family transporter [Halioglobus sp.]